MNFSDFLIFQFDRALDEIERNAPDRREETDAEQKPRERESKDALRHQFGREVIGQRQSQHDEQKGKRAGDGELELFAHQRVQEFLAVHAQLFGRPAT